MPNELASFLSEKIKTLLFEKLKKHFLEQQREGKGDFKPMLERIRVALAGHKPEASFGERGFILFRWAAPRKLELHIAGKVICKLRLPKIAAAPSHAVYGSAG